jgi:hypothetical protein
VRQGDALGPKESDKKTSSWHTLKRSYSASSTKDICAMRKPSADDLM